MAEALPIVVIPVIVIAMVSAARSRTSRRPRLVQLAGLVAALAWVVLIGSFALGSS